MTEKLKTGTTTLAVKGKDCVILAADKRVTLGNFIPQKHVQKLIEITNKLAVSISGHASEAILLAKYLRSEIQIHEIRTNRPITVKEAANLLGGWTYNALRSHAGIAHFVMAGVDKELKIYDVFADGMVSEADDYNASGSGSVHAISILDTNYTKNLPQEEVITLARKCIIAAMTRDSASGNGFDIWVITKEGIVKKITEDLTPKIQ